MRDVVTGGADVGGEHDVSGDVGGVVRHQLELEHLSPLQEWVTQVTVDTSILYQVTENICHIISSTNKGEDGAKVEVEPGKVGWLSDI